MYKQVEKTLETFPIPPFPNSKVINRCDAVANDALIKLNIETTPPTTL